MALQILPTYLNDHLAGSMAAIELLDHLRKVSKGSERETLFTALQSEIEEDQKVLKELLRGLGEQQSRVRQAAAWLTEKVGEAKLKLDDPGSGELRLLEALETLGLGILGKVALWRALAVVAERVPQIRRLDLAGLERRARDQHARVETERLKVAAPPSAPEMPSPGPPDRPARATCGMGALRWRLRRVQPLGHLLGPNAPAAWPRDRAAPEPMGSGTDRLPPADLLSDIRLLQPSGQLLSGPEVYRYMMRRIWWTYPLYLLSKVPGLSHLFDWAYRTFARHRTRISASCGVPPAD